MGLSLPSNFLRGFQEIWESILKASSTIKGPINGLNIKTSTPTEDKICPSGEVDNT